MLIVETTGLNIFVCSLLCVFCARIDVHHFELQFAPLLSKEEKESLLDKKIADMRRMNAEKEKRFRVRTVNNGIIFSQCEFLMDANFRD